MRDPQALISTEALAAALGEADLRVYDCTTYLEPPPPGNPDPYVAVPGRHTFEAAHIPVGTLPERVRYVVQSAFNGRRIVIFSGGEAKGTDAVFELTRPMNSLIFPAWFQSRTLIWYFSEFRYSSVPAIA